MACVAERPKRGSSRSVSQVTDPVLSDGAASYTPSISERRGTATTFLHSGLKNADAQTSAAGSVSGTRVYDAFGAELSSTGSWQGAFGYAGGFGYQEDTNGFKLLGHRYYDPSTGRFLTRDPAKDGRNWYVYCGNNPLNSVDDIGLGDRSLTPTESADLNKAKDRLRAIGRDDLADVLDDMQAAGRVRVSPDMEDYGLTARWPNGDSMIWLREDLFPSNWDSRIGNEQREAGLDWLAGIAGHKGYHVGMQGYVWARFHPKQKEADAWEVTISILSALRSRRSGRWAREVDTYLEMSRYNRDAYRGAEE